MMLSQLRIMFFVYWKLISTTAAVVIIIKTTTALIASNGTPNINKYYGENGALYPFYTKRQLKRRIQALGYIKERADEIFCEIDDYMLN